MKRYFWNLLIALDQFINTLMGGNPDETMSGRMGWRIQTGKATRFERWLCRVLSDIDPRGDRHCVESIEPEEEHY